METDLHHRPMVRTCRYPWWHDGDHGTEIPELFAEWDAMATYITELVAKRANGEAG